MDEGESAARTKNRKIPCIYHQKESCVSRFLDMLLDMLRSINQALHGLLEGLCFLWKNGTDDSNILCEGSQIVGVGKGYQDGGCNL